MPQLYRVLYCSRNSIEGTSEAVAADIQAILAVSRANNARDGITGGLLYSEGCFAQVLEGPIEAVANTFERIQCDNRHGEVTVLQAGPVEAREFPDWSMGFAGTAPEGDTLGVVKLASAFSGQSNDGDDVMKLLKSVVLREAEWLTAAFAMVA